MTLHLNSPSPFWIFLGLLLLAPLGCSDSKYDLAPVSGRVTFDGKPVGWGLVLFTPKQSSEKKENPGRTAVGQVDSDGNYELSTYGKHDGAIVGSHSVRFSFDRDNEAQMVAAKEFFAAKGGKVPRKLHLSNGPFEVTAGENEINLELIQ